VEVGERRRHNHVDPSQKMVLRNAIIEAERVEQPALIPPLPPPSSPSPPSPIPSADGITVRRRSQRLYRQHRSQADIHKLGAGADS
jgi:hypothetical protein